MIAAVVLAAGASRRLGRPKQLLRIGDRALVRRAAEAALEAGCSPVVVVLGAEAVLVRREVEELAVRVVECADWSEGMAASLRAGVADVAAQLEVRAVVLLPCDLPALDGPALRRVLDAFDGRPGRRVACGYEGTVGIPALFGRDAFGDLLALRGDRGAKSLLVGHAGTVIVPWPEGGRDVDRDADL